MQYLAILYPTTNGGYAVEFPDFPEVLTQGSTLNEAIDMATEALGIGIEEYVKARRDLPVPSTMEQIKEVAAHEMVTAQGIDLDRYPIFQLIRCSIPLCSPMMTDMQYTVCENETYII